MELSVAKVFTHHTAPVNSLDFTKDGERLLSSGDDHRICLYSTTQGTLEKLRQDNAHGATLARFTHDPLSIIAASPMDHAIRYISLHDEKILRTFRGHARAITSLEMSPKEDILVSASMDDTIRLWDLRQTNCQAVMRFQGGGHRPAVAFDPQGMIFAAAICGGRVKLFDVRACDKGSFLTFTLHELGATSFSGIKFSNDGNHLLVGTTHGAHALVDSFKGNVVHKFSGHKAELGLPLEACFSPNADIVLCGSDDGGIHRWETRTGKELPVLRQHKLPVTAIRCNPTRMMFASADTAVALWLPSA